MVKTELSIDLPTENIKSNFKEKYTNLDKKLTEYKSISKYWANDTNKISRNVANQLFSNPCANHLICDRWYMKFAWNALIYLPSIISDKILNKAL
jgi:hypothetical protein